MAVLSGGTTAADAATRYEGQNYVKIFYLGGFLLLQVREASPVRVMQSDINYIFLFRNALKKTRSSDEIFRADMRGC